jgi:hypothetical protein
MLKEWLWWQIEVSMEHLDDDSSISFSDLTLCFWMALVLQGVRVSSEPPILYTVHIRETPEPDRLLYGSA